MDTTQTITHIGLCAGYGGIELGLKRVLPTMRTVALCEIEAFAIANLVAKMEAGLMDPAPIWTDLKTFPWSEFSGRVDILTGGYPCQPFSAAGKRLGTDDPRHLWPYIASGIRLLRPKLCFFENVEGHISLGLREVVGELESLGYETAWGIFSAAECGAPHQRKRVFIMAVSSGFRGEARLSRSLTGHEGITGVTHYCGAQDIWPSRPGQQQYAWEPPRVVANAKGQRASSGRELCGEECRQGRALPCELDEPSQSMGNARGNGWRQDQQGRETEGRVAADGAGEGMGNAESGWRRESGNSNSERQGCGSAWTSKIHGEWNEIEQPLDRNINGVAGGLDYAELSVSCDNRTDELRLLGNGVVPATAALAFRTLLKELTQ